MKITLVAALSAVLAFDPFCAFAGAPAIPPPSQVIVPQFSTTPSPLRYLTSPARNLAPRLNIGLLKPFSGNLTFDSGNAAFNTGYTYYMAFELPIGASFSAVRPIFGNQSLNTYGITAVSFAPSAQWGPTSRTSTGVSSYDSAGNANTLWQIGSFNNGGSAAEYVPPIITGNCINASGTNASGATTINLASNPTTAGWVVGDPLISYADPETLMSGTTLTAVGTSTAGITPALAQFALASGTKLCVPTLSFTVPASADTYRQSFSFGDWTPISSLARTDSPLDYGTSAYLQNGTSLGAVASHSATQVQLSTGIPSALAAGTRVGFCQATTTSSGLAQQNTLTFSSNLPATVAVGNTVSFGSTQSQMFASEPSSIAVTGVSGATATISGNAGVPYLASGGAVQFETPMTVAQTSAAGSNQVTVTSVPSNVAPGMQVAGSGIAASSGPTVNSTTISGISGNTLTLSAVNASQLNPGDTILAVVILATSANVNLQSVTTATTNVHPGAWVIGTGLPAGTLAVAPSNASFSLSMSPTATINSGATLQVCDPLTLAQAAPAGATTLNFATTTYPQPLILMRIQVSGATTAYWYQGGSAGLIDQANWASLPGLGRYESGYCNFSTGILTPTAMGNTTAGCNRGLGFPVLALEFETQGRDLVVPISGDSVAQSFSTFALGSVNIVNAGLAPLSSATTPIWPVNMGRGGRNSDTFFSDLINLSNAGVPYSAPALIGYSWNEAYTTPQAYQHAMANLGSVIQTLTAKGEAPILVTPALRAVHGCNTTISATGLANVQASRAALLAAGAANGVPVYDLYGAEQDPNNAGFIAPGFSNDCIHMNSTTNASIGALFGAAMAKYLGL